MTSDSLLSPFDSALFQASPNAMILTDWVGRIRQANPQAVILLGLSEQALCKKTVEDFVPNRVKRNHAQHRKDFLQDPRPRAMGTGRYLEARRADGNLIPVEISLCPLHLDGQTFVVATLVDITLQREQEEELQGFRTSLERLVAEKTAELEMAKNDLETFVYSVSHDLRAPLRAINGFAQALQEDYGETLSETGQFYWQQVLGASKRMADLIDGLLTLSRIWRQPVVLAPVDISILAVRILEELQAGQQERRVKWIVQPNMVLLGDEKLLGIALLNLLENAWKYTSRKDVAEISVSLQHLEERKWITISDNGAGFNANYQSNLFKPFQRLHREDEFPGLGIGLATVKKICDLLGYEIEASGQENKGAEFRFSPTREAV